MIAWTTLEDAIQSWVATTSGLTTIWGGGGGPRPDDQFIELSAVVTPIGQGFTVYSDADPVVPEAELEETNYRVQELALTMTCYGGLSTEGTNPVAVLDNVLHAAKLTARRDLLRAGGWLPARENPILRIGGPIGGSVFEPRASTTCFGNVSSSLVGTSTYIQIVEVTNLLTGVETSLDSEA